MSFIHIKAAGAALLCLAVASQAASAGAGAIGAANTNRPGITLIHGGGRSGGSGGMGRPGGGWSGMGMGSMNTRPYISGLGVKPGVKSGGWSGGSVSHEGHEHHGHRRVFGRGFWWYDDDSDYDYDYPYYGYEYRKPEDYRYKRVHRRRHHRARHHHKHHRES
ncbi:MAG: hypothetical protein WBX25_09665 [Rhodomicrobium sp.]